MESLHFYRKVRVTFLVKKNLILFSNFHLPLRYKHSIKNMLNSKLYQYHVITIDWYRNLNLKKNRGRSVTIMRKGKLMVLLIGWGGAVGVCWKRFIVTYFPLAGIVWAEANVSSRNKIRKKPASFFYDLNGFFSLPNKVWNVEHQRHNLPVQFPRLGRRWLALPQRTARVTILRISFTPSISKRRIRFVVWLLSFDRCCLILRLL